MDDFHNQFNGYSNEKAFNPISSTYGNPMTNQKANQTVFQTRSNQTSKRTSHPLLFTPPLVIDTMIQKNESKQSFHLNKLQSDEENTHSIEEGSPSSDLETSLFEKLEDQFFNMLEESSDHLDVSSSVYEESSGPFEESSSVYEESSDHFEESSSLYEESSGPFEESSSVYEESSRTF